MMATEQPIPERPTPDWSVEPRPCACRWPELHLSDDSPEPLRWDGDDT